MREYVGVEPTRPIVGTHAALKAGGATGPLLLPDTLFNISNE